MRWHCNGKGMSHLDTFLVLVFYLESHLIVTEWTVTASRVVAFLQKEIYGVPLGITVDPFQMSKLIFLCPVCVHTIFRMCIKLQLIEKLFLSCTWTSLQLLAHPGAVSKCSQTGHRNSALQPAGCAGLFLLLWPVQVSTWWAATAASCTVRASSLEGLAALSCQSHIFCWKCCFLCFSSSR